jgi:hypothetical protein
VHGVAACGRFAWTQTNARLVEANRMYTEAGYREIEDYNSNPRANRWYEKLLA